MVGDEAVRLHVERLPELVAPESNHQLLVAEAVGVARKEGLVVASCSPPVPVGQSSPLVLGP